MTQHAEIFFATVIPFFEHLPGNWDFRSDVDKYNFLVNNLPVEKLNKAKDELSEYFINKYGTEFQFCFLEFDTVDSEKYDYYLHLIDSLRFEASH